MEITKSIQDVFTKAQESSFDAEIGIEDLRKIISSLSGLEKIKAQTEFTNGVLRIIEILLTTSNNYRLNFSIEFLVKFLAEFNQTEDEASIQNDIIHYLLRNHRANSDFVRLRIFEILSKFLQLLNISSKGQLDDKVFLKMQQISLGGVRDCNLSVQKSAIKTASLLQVPKDKYCKIIDSFVQLLLHDSLTEIRLIVLDHLAINNLTFELFKNKLIYDSDSCIRHKVLELIEKKVPSKFIDSKFKKQILTCLIKDYNNELITKFILKFMDLDTRNVETINKFLVGLEIKDLWYIELEFSYLSYVDANLSILMNLIFENLFTNNSNVFKLILEQLNVFLSIDELFLNFEKSFLLRSLLIYVKEKNLKDQLKQHFKLDVVNFYDRLVSSLKENSICFLNFYNLIRIYFELEDNELAKINALSNLIGSIDIYNNNQTEILYETILSKFEPKTLTEFIWEFYKKGIDSDEKKKKFLSLFSIVLARIDKDGFKSADNLNLNLDLCERIDFDLDIDLNQNIIEFMVESFVIKNFSSLEPKIRALCARALGQASLLSFNIAKSYFHIYNQMIYLDYSEPVVEATKALVNILFIYSHEFDLNNPVGIKAFERLENQIDCLDPLCKYLACEGFCKLFLNNCSIPNKKNVLPKLVLTLFGEETSINSSVENTKMNSKLKACLCEFFNQFKLDKKFGGKNTYRNIISLSKTIRTVLIFLIKKNSSVSSLKRVANFYYYITSEIKNARLLIVSSILKEIATSFNNFYLVQKLIEILCEFNIHQSDLDLEDNRSNTMKALDQVNDQFVNLISKFKSEKWIFYKENEVKQFMTTIRNLISKNDRTLNKRKRDDSDDQDEVCL